MTEDPHDAHRRRLAAAAEIAAGALAAESDHALCDVAFARLCALVSATCGVLVQADGAAGCVHAVAGCAEDAVGRTITPSRRGAAEVLEALAGGGPVRAVLDAPLRVRDHVVGSIVLGRHDGPPFAAEDLALVELVSPRFALLVERHRLLHAEAAARSAATSAIEALRERDERFAAMLDGAHAFLGLLGVDGRVLEVNRAALEFAGTTRANVVGRPFWDTPWWAHDERQRERLRRALEAAAGGTADAFEATHVSPSHVVIDVDFAVRPARSADGVLRYLIVEGGDVSTRSAERRALTDHRDELVRRVSDQADRLAVAEGDLYQAQALYRAVAETIVDGLVVIDEVGTIEWLNAAATAMFGYTLDELRGRNVSTLMPPPFRDEHDGYLKRYLATGERRIIGIGREVRGRRADGTEFPLSLAVGETPIGGARKFTGILRDLTGQKRLEQLLQERQTLARVGELAAVVAHEVRNPLAAIKGVVEVIQTRFAPESPDRRVLGDLLTRVDSLDHLVSDLLVYARPVPPVFEPVALLGLVHDTVALAARDPETAHVRFEVGGEDAELWVDPAQLGRALLNLMTNAAQAMRQGGVVRVTGTRRGDRYRITVGDDGPGMSAEVAARCLEPFYTTKTRGTGLGLSIARRVVEEHHGTFHLETEPGRGTTVIIDLPTSHDAGA